MYDFTQLINDVVAAGLAVSGIVGLARKGKLNIHAIKTVAEDVVHVAEDVIKTPAGKVIEAELHHKLNQFQDQFQKSELGRLALVALHGAESTYDSLSDSEKAAVIAFMKSELQNAHIQVSDSDIVGVIREVQKESDKFKLDERFVKAKEFTQILQSINKPQEVIQDVQTQQTPA